MAGCVNKVVLVGCVGKYGIQMRFTPGGSACASFTLVLTEQAPDGKCYSTLVPCEVWGKKAEGLSDLEPGQLCLFEGKLAKRKKDATWELLVSGFDVTPIAAAVEASATRPPGW